MNQLLIKVATNNGPRVFKSIGSLRARVHSQVLIWWFVAAGREGTYLRAGPQDSRVEKQMRAFHRCLQRSLNRRVGKNMPREKTFWLLVKRGGGTPRKQGTEITDRNE